MWQESVKVDRSPSRDIADGVSKAKNFIRPWHIWIGSGVLVGLVLGFSKLPATLLPIGVGLGTAAVVVVLLRQMMLADAEEKKSKRT